MRVISARIQGYGRLADVKINLDSKVIAIVGPNEAGKTTLLRALARMDSQDELAVPQRARAADVSDETVVTSVEYVLDDEDRDSVADLGLEESPKSMTANRLARGGPVTMIIRPTPIKDRSRVRTLVAALSRYLEDPNLPGYVDPDTTYADPHSDAPRDYRAELESLIDQIKELLAGNGDPAEHGRLASDCESLLEGTMAEGGAEELHQTISGLIQWLTIEDPLGAAQKRLWGRTPDFLLFSEEDRTLSSSYNFDENLLINTPPALSNLVGMAGLDLAKLLEFHQSSNFGPRSTAIKQANSRLDTAFKESWKQSRLSVWFDIDGSQLRVMVWEDGDNITVFNERSAGLQMFIALTAFLKVQGSSRPPILLIDEAENHLHIDAQADLVGMFMVQEQAAKVVYTTHSPACLPPDLGSGVRSVVPRKDNQQVSDVRNSFWQGAAGYSPLMLAMGAAAAAFTPARCVVLAEGATEMILLPSLIRAATKLSSLDYQVAPGLSEVPKDLYAQLDFEGAKVAYLIDGDGGGRSLKRGLIRAGVPENLIIMLDVPGIENALEVDAYLSAVNALLPECNPQTMLPELPQLGDPGESSWAKQLSDWAENEKLSFPSKVAIATWLVENSRVEPHDKFVSHIVSVHESLSGLFST